MPISSAATKLPRGRCAGLGGRARPALLCLAAAGAFARGFGRCPACPHLFDRGHVLFAVGRPFLAGGGSFAGSGAIRTTSRSGSRMSIACTSRWRMAWSRCRRARSAQAAAASSAGSSTSIALSIRRFQRRPPTSTAAVTRAARVRLARQHCQQFRRVRRGVLADHHRQFRKAVETGDRDHRAAAVDQVDLAAMLPQRHRLALDQADIDRVGQAALDQRRADPGQAFELLFGALRVDRQDRRAGAGAERGEDRLAVGRGAPLDADVGDPEPERGAGFDQALRGAVRNRPIQGLAGDEHRAAGAGGEHDRDAAPHYSAAQACSPAPPHPHPIPMGRGVHPSHAACSTIHTTSSSKPMPAWRAISGTSEVGVMPGWVLTSSR